MEGLSVLSDGRVVGSQGPMVFSGGNEQKERKHNHRTHSKRLPVDTTPQTHSALRSWHNPPQTQSPTQATARLDTRHTTHALHTPHHTPTHETTQSVDKNVRRFLLCSLLQVVLVLISSTSTVSNLPTARDGDQTDASADFAPFFR